MYPAKEPEVVGGSVETDELCIEQGKMDIKQAYLAGWHHGVNLRLSQNTWVLNMDVRSHRWWDDRL